MGKFNPSLHPRGKGGKFVSKAGGGRGSSRRSGSSAKRNIQRALAVKSVYGDIKDVGEHSAKAYAYGATGNYVKSALHGTKASTAASRLGSQAAGAYVKRSKTIAPAKKRKFYAAQATFDKRVDTIDSAATIGLVITGAGLRRKSRSQSLATPRTAGLKPAKAKKGVYQITSAKRVTAGSRVRR